MLKIMNLRLVLMVFYCATVITCKRVNILRSMYWLQTIIEKQNTTPPIGIEYDSTKTLIFFKDKIVRYKTGDYKSFEELSLNSYKMKEKAFFVVDDRYELSKQDETWWLFNSKTMYTYQVESKANEEFNDVDLDVTRNRAFMIGVETGFSTGTLYAFDPNNFNIHKNESIILQTVDVLGDRLSAISIDGVTGNVAIVEKSLDQSWKVILLVANDFKLLEEDRDESDDGLYFKLSMSTPRSSGFERNFEKAVEQISNDVIVLCRQTNHENSRILTIENHMLRKEIYNLKRKFPYILKSKDIYFNTIVNKTTSFSFVKQETDDKFVDYVENAGKSIIGLLDETNMMWRDQTQCGNFLEKDNFTDTEYTYDLKFSQCGTLPKNSSQEYLPWSVFILKSPQIYTTNYSFVCFGALIHPKLVFVSAYACTIDPELTTGSYISRSGRYNEDFFKTNLPFQDRQVVKVLNQYNKDQIQLLVLDQEYPGSHIICIAPPNVFTRIVNCIVVSHLQSDGKNKVTISKMYGKNIKMCTKTNNLYRKEEKVCNEKFDAMFCVNNKRFVLAAVHHYTQNCTEILLQVSNVRPLIEKVLSMPEYDLSEYHLPSD